MDDKCDYLSIKFLNWVGRIHGESAAASIEKNQLTLVKVSLPPDMTQAEYDAQTMMENKDDTARSEGLKGRPSEIIRSALKIVRQFHRI